MDLPETNKNKVLEQLIKTLIFCIKKTTMIKSRKLKVQMKTFYFLKMLLNLKTQKRNHGNFSTNISTLIKFDFRSLLL